MKSLVFRLLIMVLLSLSNRQRQVMLGVIRTLPLSLQGPDNASLPGNLSNVLLAGLFRSATEPDNKTFDRQFGTDNRRCRGHYQCQTACQRRVIPLYHDERRIRIQSTKSSR